MSIRHRLVRLLVTRLFPGRAREDALESLVERTLRERDVARGKLWRAERAMEAAVVLTDIQQGQRDAAIARAEKAEASIAACPHPHGGSIEPKPISCSWCDEPACRGVYNDHDRKEPICEACFRNDYLDSEDIHARVVEREASERRALSANKDTDR